MPTKRIILVAVLFFPLGIFLLALWLAPTRVLNALTPTRNLIIDKDIAYAAQLSGDERLRLDIYRPRAAAAPLPIVVFFYGGSWNSGDRADYRFVAAALAAQGFAVLVPDYRLYPEVSYPAFLQDCAAAVAWAVRNAGKYGGDDRRVYLMGHSAGAYNAAMLALDSRWLTEQGLRPAQLKGWIGLAGPYDFLPSNNPKVMPVFHHPHYPAGAQPIEYAKAGTAPAFIAAPASDDLVDPRRNSLQLAESLRLAHTRVTVKIYDRVDHITLIGAWAQPLRWLAPVFDDAITFLKSG